MAFSRLRRAILNQWKLNAQPARMRKQSRHDRQPPIFELQPLEKRLFLTASPTISVTTSNPLEGQQVDVALASNDSDGEGIDHWAIDWGDGTSPDTVNG